MDEKKIAERLTRDVILARGGDPWGERNRAVKVLKELADSVNGIGIAEDRYHFDDPKYAKKVDSGMAKITKAIEDASRKIGALVKAMG